MSFVSFARRRSTAELVSKDGRDWSPTMGMAPAGPLIDQQQRIAAGRNSVGHF